MDWAKCLDKLGEFSAAHGGQFGAGIFVGAVIVWISNYQSRKHDNLRFDKQMDAEAEFRKQLDQKEKRIDKLHGEKLELSAKVGDLEGQIKVLSGKRDKGSGK